MDIIGLNQFEQSKWIVQCRDLYVISLIYLKTYAPDFVNASVII